MIKVSFRSANAVDDVCHTLEEYLTDNAEIEEWLMKEIPSIYFHCMDYPSDLEAFYDCYFESSEDETDSYKIVRLLKEKIEGCVQVDYKVSIVDKYLDCIREIKI